jgi:hypothetical protein
MSTKVFKIGDFDEAERRKQEDRVFILENLIERVQSGEVTEFVVVVNGPQGDVNVSMYTDDIVAAVGLFEVGKSILLNTEIKSQMFDEEEDEQE